MKEDVLEQLVDDYLQHKGYFTIHNVKYRPDPNHPEYIKSRDSNHSDIDVLGINPTITGPARVMAVSCKSWQSGLNTKTKISEIEKNKIVSGHEAWKGFRELVIPKWSNAFMTTVEEMTGEPEFTYVTAIAVLKGDRDLWENYQLFVDNLNGNPVTILTFSEILDEIMPSLNTTVAPTEIGRMLQLIKASGWKQ